MSGKLATNLTPEQLVEEKNFREVHSILHYIDKDDPQGDSSPDRNSDQYERWEEAVKVWADENEYVSEEPPTESDNIHTITNKPKIKIISPNQSQTIDDRLIKEINSSPFNLDDYVGDPNIGKGFYRLKVVAYDDVENLNSDEIDVNIQFDPLPSAKLTWQQPSNGEVLTNNSFPYTTKANLDNIENVKEIDLYIRAELNQRIYINTARSFLNNNLTLQWLNKPKSGTYKLFGEIKNTDGYSYWSDEIEIIIE